LEGKWKNEGDQKNKVISLLGILGRRSRGGKDLCKQLRKDEPGRTRVKKIPRKYVRIGAIAVSSGGKEESLEREGKEAPILEEGKGGIRGKKKKKKKTCVRNGSWGGKASSFAKGEKEKNWQGD